MRKIIVVSLALAVFAASGSALAASKSEGRVKASPNVATLTASSRVTSTHAAQVTKSASVQVASAAAKKARKSKSPAVIPAATPPIMVVPGCDGSIGIFGATASACAGFFSGNLLNGSPTDLAAQDAALAQLGLDFSGDLSSYLKIDTSDATFLDFGQALFGNTIIGIHFGNGSGVGNSTGFFQFDFSSAVNGIELNMPASSGAVLYRTGSPVLSPAPEPGTWLMMLLGFGLVGFSIRRKGRAYLMAQAA